MFGGAGISLWWSSSSLSSNILFPESSPNHQTGVVPEGPGSGDLMVYKPSPRQLFRGLGTPATLIYKRPSKSESQELPSTPCRPHTSGLSCQSELRVSLLPGASWAGPGNSDPDSNSTDKLPATGRGGGTAVRAPGSGPGGAPGLPRSPKG